MRINPANNTPQGNKLNNVRKEPSFKANVEISADALLALRNELSRFYSECALEARPRFFGREKFDFAKAFIRYKQAIEEATQGIKGTIKIRMGESHVPYPELTYKTPEGKILKSKTGMFNIMPNTVLPDTNYDAGIPMSHAVKNTMATLADIVGETEGGYGRNNPFARLF